MKFWAKFFLKIDEDKASTYGSFARVTFPSTKLLGFSAMVTMEGQIGEGLGDDLCGCLERRRD
jgi:hypothetical protein